MADPVRILADVQEERSGIPGLLRELGAEVEVAPLPAGDYGLGADTLVERKRVLDLHTAVSKGHLWPQLARLRAACPFPYLLVEGNNLDRGGLHPNAIRGVCLAAIDLGIALLRSDHQRDSARWLHRLAVRCQRVERPAELPPYVPRPALSPESVAEAMLVGVPGISSVGARALLEHFGSLAGVLAASSEEWLEVPGIGPERVRALAEALGTLTGGLAATPPGERSSDQHVNQPQPEPEAAPTRPSAAHADLVGGEEHATVREGEYPISRNPCGYAKPSGDQTRPYPDRPNPHG